MIKHRTTLLIAMAAIANNVLADPSNIPLLITGSYCAQGSSCYDATIPLVIDSLDQGQSWVAVNPSFSANVELHHTSCNKIGCTMVGFSMSKVAISPIIIRSNTTLTSWAPAKITGMPFGGVFSNLTEINCQGDHCLAQGRYVVAPHLFTEKPLILDSRNAGQKWNFVALPNTDLLNYENSAFSCGDNFCVLIGRYHQENQYNDLPIFYTNGNDQNTWDSTVTINGTPFPFKTASYDISSLSCSGNSCVAIGSYEVGSSLSKHILNLRSSDRGKSWYFNDGLSTVLGNVNKLSNISCANNTCIVAAYYDYDQPVIVAVSHDQGATWSLGYKAKGSESSDLVVNCKDNTCLVSLNTGENLALLTSQDGGYNWNYNLHLLTAQSTIISISSLACEANNCFIVGSYLNDEPFIMISHDSGISWVVNQKVSHLPDKISEVTLDSISNVMSELTSIFSAMGQTKKAAWKSATES